MSSKTKALWCTHRPKEETAFYCSSASVDGVPVIVVLAIAEGYGGWSYLGDFPHGSRNGNLTKPPTILRCSQVVRHQTLTLVFRVFESHHLSQN